MLTKKGGNGFPYLVFMDAEGNVLCEPAGRGVKDFESGEQKVGAFLELKAKPDKSDAEQVELLILEIEFGTAKPEDARKRAKELEPKLDAATKKKLAEGLAVLEKRAYDKEVQELFAKHRPRSREEAQKVVAQLGPKLWEDHQAGKRPTDDPQGAGQLVYQVLLQYGLENKVAPAARAGYAGLEKLYGRYPQARAKLDQVKKQVEALEAEGGGGGK